MKKKRRLLAKTKLGEFLTIGCEQEGDEVGLYIASADVSASCGFKIEEWENFVKGIIEANNKLKGLFK